MNEIKYKLATLDDLQILVDSRVEFMEDYWEKQNASIEDKLREELKKFFTESIPAQTYISYLAFDEDKWVAVGGMKIQQRPGSFRLPDGISAYVMNMYTRPEYRRQGIGYTIMNKLVEKGREMNIRLFELTATKEGEPMYIKFGYEKHSEPFYKKMFL